MESDEKLGGASRNFRQMDAFRNAIHISGLYDLNYQDQPFTWQRGNTKDNMIQDRLDRAKANIHRHQ